MSMYVYVPIYEPLMHMYRCHKAPPSSSRTRYQFFSFCGV